MNHTNNRRNHGGMCLPPVTPAKRKLLSTPCQTPHRSIRRLNASTSVRSPKVQLRYSSSPSSPLAHFRSHSSSPFLNEDRFIPNRACVDTPRARKPLFEESFEHRDDIDDNDDTEYKRQLRRTLFGDDFLASSSSKSLLGLAGHHGAVSTLREKLSTIDPANVDVLRSTLKPDVAFQLFLAKGLSRRTCCQDPNPTWNGLPTGCSTSY